MKIASSLEAVDSVAGTSLSNRSVERACRLLSVFNLDEPWLSLAEMARRAELPKATAHRLAVALRTCGLLSQAADGRYGLGVKLLELGAVVRENLDVLQLCRSAIDAVSAASGETVVLGTVEWSTRELLLVARRDSPHPLAVGSPVGRRQPIPPGGALGKAVLSGLPADELESVLAELTLVAMTPKTPIERRLLLRHVALARQMGYASEQDEYIDGVSGVAVPVVFEGGRPLAGLGVVGPTSRMADKIPTLGALLLEHTAGLRPRPLVQRLRQHA
ncbi:MAG TPA: IclR family transcriptional regulator [Solirubrobacteraceae bacterium]